jgi:hypothetical protein
MHQVRLADNLYKEAEQRATEAGFASVDEYVADVVSNDLHDDPENFDHLFTPERIAHLERASAEAKAGGKTYSVEEVKEHLKQNRQEWLKNHEK